MLNVKSRPDGASVRGSHNYKGIELATIRALVWLYAFYHLAIRAVEFKNMIYIKNTFKIQSSSLSHPSSFQLQVFSYSQLTARCMYTGHQIMFSGTVSPFYIHLCRPRELTQYSRLVHLGTCVKSFTYNLVLVIVLLSYLFLTSKYCWLVSSKPGKRIVKRYTEAFAQPWETLG